MPGEHLTPGFFGKLPAAGDFVSRGLPESFVRRWDVFCTRHLLQPLAAARAAGGVAALRFLVGADEGGPLGGPLGGVVVASADRVGRRFPLTVAASLPEPTAELPMMADRWFAALERAADAARTAELDVAGLADRLRGLPFTAPDAGGEPLTGLVFWTDPCELHRAEPDAPEDVLALLLGQPERVA